MSEVVTVTSLPEREIHAEYVVGVKASVSVKEQSTPWVYAGIVQV